MITLISIAQITTVTSIKLNEDVTMYYVNTIPMYDPFIVNYPKISVELPIEHIYVPIVIPSYTPIKIIDVSNPTNVNININVIDWMKLDKSISTSNVMQFEQELNTILFK
jgi:hypothetical protein